MSSGLYIAVHCVKDNIPAFQVRLEQFFSCGTYKLSDSRVTKLDVNLFVMAEGMPYFKSHKTPVESFDESLEEIERQASLLFEEFLRLAEPVHSVGFGRRAKSEQSDSPVVFDQKQFRGKL